jgi:hypothetical protein
MNVEYSLSGSKAHVRRSTIMSEEICVLRAQGLR